MRKIYKIISNVVLVAVLGIGLLVALSFFKIPGGIKLFTVMSGSMEPVLHTGSVIFIKSTPDYNVDDIITRATDDPKVTITHRIVGKEERDGQKFFQTKGDANNAPDEGLFAQDVIVGKEFLTIPYLGFAVAFAKTQQGIILLIIIPAVIIVYEELNKIKKEVVKIAREKKKKKEVKEDEDSEIKEIKFEHAQKQEGEK